MLPTIAKKSGDMGISAELRGRGGEESTKEEEV